MKACTFFAHALSTSGELGRIVGIADGSGTQTVTQRQGHIVLCTDVADVVEMLVEETLAVVCQAP